ncbi:RNA polymerase Rpb4-domain-containing protein [Echria macrotheca]|uniref:DNA-directed RNA polymerase III subunit RPC9 n=1 Tax=Echria macrotheca TaxID=438768 RepID=A0AAJ0FFH3_9PEZI|nr:RNA polymerase Rpb4-domain-containing protein [Echria macrotheca]
MKVLEAQTALLSNYEVYQHIVDTYKTDNAKKRRIPGNLAMMVTEVLGYLRTAPSPLAKQDETGAYSPEALPRLIERLSEENFGSELTKAELLMIFNLRPSNNAVLSTTIEDMIERFTEEEQARLVEVFTEVLGSNPPDPVEAAEDESAIPSIENGQ